MWNSMNSIFLRSVDNYVAQHKLLTPHGKYVVALSGGADSVALLYYMVYGKYDVEAVHCNFRLRGEESDRDERFCENLCTKMKVPLHKVHFDTKSYAQLHHVSIEMAARELRYAYFEQLRKDLGAEDICVAHHRDDNVETVIMNMVRGTGLKGMMGIQPRNGHVVRPLLAVDRKLIVCFLKDKGLEYVTDSTNFECLYTRNKVRLNVVPMLNEINPEASRHIDLLTQRMCAAEEVYRCGLEVMTADMSDEGRENGNVVKALIRDKVKNEQVLYEVLAEYGFNAVQVSDIFNNISSQTGKQFFSTDYVAVTDRRHLLVYAREKEEPQPLRLPETGRYAVTGGGNSIKLMVAPREDGAMPSKEPFCITLDAEKVKWPLVLRRSKEGDSLLPFGMKGKKLVSDLLTDAKRSVVEKERQWLLCDADDSIMWVVGLRTDRRYSMTESTTKVLTVWWL